MMTMMKLIPLVIRTGNDICDLTNSFYLQPMFKSSGKQPYSMKTRLDKSDEDDVVQAGRAVRGVRFNLNGSKCTPIGSETSPIEAHDTQGKEA